MIELGMRSKVIKRLSEVKHSRIDRRWTSGARGRHKKSCRRLNRALRRMIDQELAAFVK